MSPTGERASGVVPPTRVEAAGGRGLSKGAGEGGARYGARPVGALGARDGALVCGFGALETAPERRERRSEGFDSDPCEVVLGLAAPEGDAQGLAHLDHALGCD